ncbi:MAG: potassium channel family protein [Gemmatimonadaceae bacterium]
MTDWRDELNALGRRILTPIAVLFATYLVGIVGYKWIGGRDHSWLDALYMTTITLTTTGYREVIDITQHPAAMIFTIVLLLFGATAVVMTGSMLTAYVVEGDLTAGFRRRRMQKRIDAMRAHTIVCGAGQTGTAVVRELAATDRSVVAIEGNAERAAVFEKLFAGVPVLVGDCTDDEVLTQAGIGRASGVVVCTDDDKVALVTTVLARQMAPKARLVARASDERAAARLRQSGADAVVSPGRIGGMRMASELLRPSVVTFLDQMLRDENRNLRIEEVQVEQGSSLDARQVESLRLHEYGTGLLLLAMRQRDGSYVFNPPASTQVNGGCCLIVMGDPASVTRLQEAGVARR